MQPRESTTQYLETVRDVYAQAAVTPQPKLCCTTAPIWRLPGLTVPLVMQEMNYGCGTTVHPADIGPDDTILYVGVGGGMEALQLAYFARRPGGVVAVDTVSAMLEKARANFQVAARENPWFQPDFGHTLSRDLPLAICDKTSEALRRLERTDILLTGSTFHYRGGGCC
jgi:SAM-dependent methyltransferase